ncbi:hypothetical protein MTR62_15645 [Novosphingobium sp. 1949]|uniref:Lipoprotein n=1 Tax=Novosphingobium organovorum TaxID=2930092 RepID=A0ABT0BH05_9SPHN|nr:hypothetical protein [Novosphingobium organovorum]MCJ2184113.1 hypothetical protein [Novosphingobium organovorum]
MSRAAQRPRASLAPVAALAALLAAGALLGGCHDKKKDPVSADAAQGAELLPRSVTDAMPAYDTVRSKAPLVEPSAPAAHAGSAAVTPDVDDDGPDDGADLPQGEPEEPAPMVETTPGAG